MYKYARGARGWQYEVERTAAHAKPGFISREAGATLDLCFPLRWPEERPRPNLARPRPNLARPRLNLALGYLRSYDETMGHAGLSYP